MVTVILRRYAGGLGHAPTGLRPAGGKLYQDWPVPKNGQDAARRPQWRGERRAVLVRLPVAVAAELQDRAHAHGQLLSDAAVELLSGGLSSGQRGGSR